MEKVSFKEAKESELNIILDIYNYYILNTTANYYRESVSIDILKNHIFINHDKYKTYLVYDQNEFAGFCYLTQFRKKDAYYRTAEIGIYLKPNYTGRKLGEQIITYLESIAKANQFKVLIASISNENTASNKLVQRMGYTECAHYKKVAEKFGRVLDVIDYQKIFEN
jgi:L-amino acid N-acyltransferase YncA